MLPVIPTSIVIVSVAINVVIAVAVWRILAAAGARSGLPPGRQRFMRVVTGLVLGGWLGAALLLAPAPESVLSRDPFSLTPLIPLFAVTSLTITLLAVRSSSAFRRVLDAASLPAMIGVQLYRTIGLLFVILLGLGQLPAHFAQPAGWGDIAIGLSAPLVALALARGPAGSVSLAYAWNLVGLADLAVAVGLGTGYLAPLLVPSLGARVPPAAAMGVFPLILVPTFAVPVSVLLHLLSLRKLRREARPGGRLVPSPAA
jgi:hypothetical protein